MSYKETVTEPDCPECDTPMHFRDEDVPFWTDDNKMYMEVKFHCPKCDCIVTQRFQCVAQFHGGTNRWYGEPKR